MPEHLGLGPGNGVPLARAIHAFRPIWTPVGPVAPIAYRHYGHLLALEVLHRRWFPLVVAYDDVPICVVGLATSAPLRRLLGLAS